MPKPIQFKELLLLMLLFNSSTNVFSQNTIPYVDNQWKDYRYIKKDGIVTDIKTALMWKQCSEGLSSGCTTGTATTHTYKEAIELANSTTFATYSDWRLPNIKELASLATHNRYHPAINSIFFPNTPSSDFWSSAPYANDVDDARTLNFNIGYDDNSIRSNSHYVRLVRGGQ
jgi:hypothetical protein